MAAEWILLQGALRKGGKTIKTPAQVGVRKAHRLAKLPGQRAQKKRLKETRA
jgi:hypothetical protein